MFQLLSKSFLISALNLRDFKTHGNKFNKDYILKVVQNGTADFGHCAKFWPVSNAYTRVSLGTFCQRGKFNNPLNCAAICEINDAKVRFLSHNDFDTVIG